MFSFSSLLQSTRLRLIEWEICNYLYLFDLISLSAWLFLCPWLFRHSGPDASMVNTVSFMHADKNHRRRSFSYMKFTSGSVLSGCTREPGSLHGQDKSQSPSLRRPIPIIPLIIAFNSKASLVPDEPSTNTLTFLLFFLLVFAAINPFDGLFGPRSGLELGTEIV